MSDINMTPLIDVMLVLLVIFIITAPLMVSAVKVDLPKAESAKAVAVPKFVALAVDKAGAALVPKVKSPPTTRELDERTRFAVAPKVPPLIVRAPVPNADAARATTVPAFMAKPPV